jgi:hypothetical protein
MDETRPKAFFAYLSFWFGLAWWVIAALILAWAFLVATDPKEGVTAGVLLILGWVATGPFAIISWLVAVTSGERRRRGWWLAWIGLLMGLSGPAHLAMLLLLT